MKGKRRKPDGDVEALNIVKSIRDDPDLEFTPESVIESIEGLVEEARQTRSDIYDE